VWSINFYFNVTTAVCNLVFASQDSYMYKLCHCTHHIILCLWFQNFVTEFSAVFAESAFEKEECKSLLNQIICEHFLRQGKLDIAEALNEVKQRKLWLIILIIYIDGFWDLKIFVSSCCVAIEYHKKCFEIPTISILLLIAEISFTRFYHLSEKNWHI